MQRWLVGVILALLAGSAGVARAQAAASTCTEEPQICGKLAFQAGIAAFERGEFEVALERFREAQALKPHPVILYNVALAEAEIGMLVEAEAHFDEVFRDPATPADQLDAARRERDRVALLVARVGVDRADAELLVDGAVAQGSPPEMRVNPGARHVQVLLGGAVVVDRKVELGRGERLQLAVAVPEPEPEPEPEPLPVSPPPKLDSARGLSPTWVYVGAGMTVVLLGATVWSGLDANATYDAFERDVPDLSRSEARQRVDDGQAADLRTNLLLGATAVMGLATGGVALFAVDWGATGGESAGEVAVGMGPGTIAVRGAF